MTPSARLFLFKRISKCTFLSFTSTKRRQWYCYFLLLTVPSPPALLILSLSYSLSHTITKYQALPSPISCMLGELHRSAGPRIRTHSQLLLVPVFVNHTYTRRYFSQRALNEAARESCCQGLVCSETSEGKHKVCVLVVNTEKARRYESCA